jgi:hypothetical protein
MKDDDEPLPPLGTGGRDRAGVVAIFEGDPIPTRAELARRGYSQVVIVSRRPPEPTGSSDVTNSQAMAMDEMPKRMAREQAIGADERYRSLYNRYLRGDFPPSSNKEIEQFLCQLEDRLKELESEIATVRNGRPDTARRTCRTKIELAREAGIWPGGQSDQQWADKWGVELRTYRRAKQEFLLGFVSADDA